MAKVAAGGIKEEHRWLGDGDEREKWWGNEGKDGFGVHGCMDTRRRSASCSHACVHAPCPEVDDTSFLSPSTTTRTPNEIQKQEWPRNEKCIKQSIEENK